MALRVGELRAVLEVDASRWARGLDRARVRMAGLQRDTNGRLRDMRGRFASAGDDSGRSFVRRLLSRIGDGLKAGLQGTLQAGMTGLRGLSSAISSNPYTAAAGAALAAALFYTALPALAALFSTAVISVAGIAVVGLGYALLKGEPEIKKATKHLKKTIGGILRDAAKPLKGEFLDAFDKIEKTAKKLKPFFDAIFLAASKLIDPLVDGFTSLVTNIMPGFTDMMENSKPTFEGLSTLLSDIGEGLSGFFMAIGQAAPDTKVLLQDVGTLIKNVLIYGGILIGWLAGAYTGVRGFVLKVIHWFQHLYDVLVGHSIIPDLVTAIVRWILSLPGKILGGLASFVARVIGYFGRMASGARGKIGDIIHTVAGLPGRVLHALGNLGSYLWNSGASLIQGFINGIWSKLGGVRNAAASLLQAARNYFPFSPAKEGPFSGRGWTEYSGRALIEGFQAGIRQQLPALQAQLGGLGVGMPAVGAAGATPGFPRAGIGRPQRVQVVLKVDGGDDDIVRMIRKSVRIQGGDVQAVLGAGR